MLAHAAQDVGDRSAVVKSRVSMCVFFHRKAVKNQSRVFRGLIVSREMWFRSVQWGRVAWRVGDA